MGSNGQRVLVGFLAGVLTLALAVPALAATQWYPVRAKERFQDEPRAWDNHNMVDGVPNGGGTGGQFPENGQAFATGYNSGTGTHYRYAIWTADRISGNEQQPLVPYGGAGNPSAAKDCTLASNSGALNAATTRDITAATWSGGASTFTTSSAGGSAGGGVPHRFFVGDQVNITGVSPAGYNQTGTIVSANGGLYSVTVNGPVANPGVYVSGGSISRSWNCSGTYFARSITDRNVTTLSVTAASRSGAYITYTTSAAHGLSAGDPINVWGSNDNYEIAATVFDVPTATTVRVCHTCVGYPPAPGSYSGGASLYKSTWVWDGGGPATGCNTAICQQYGIDAYPVGDLNHHQMTASIAAAGQYVFVLYSDTNGYYTEMCQPDPRTMYVRTNSNYGAADSWTPAVRLSSLSGHVGYGTMGAGGTNSGYAAWTDGDSGNIMVAVTTDGGGSWNIQDVANTRKIYDDETMPGSPACSGSPLTTPNPPFNGTSPSIEGFDGSPNIAGNGSQVGLTWITGNAAQTSARAMAKISTDNGATWPTSGPGNYGKSCTGTRDCTQILTRDGGGGWLPSTCTTTTITGGGSAGLANCFVANNGVAATTNRIGFMWGDSEQTAAGPFQGPRGIYYKEYNATTGWLPTRVAGCLQDTFGCPLAGGNGMAANYNFGYSPSVALYGTTGVAYSATFCQLADASCTDTYILYRESGNNGLTWHDGCNEAGGACSRFEVVANSNWTTGGGTGLSSQINEYSSTALDKTTGTAGCASTGTSAGGTTGLPETGCVTFVYHLGRDTGYYYYRMYTATKFNT